MRSSRSDGDAGDVGAGDATGRRGQSLLELPELLEPLEPPDPLELPEPLEELELLGVGALPAVDGVAVLVDEPLPELSELLAPSDDGLDAVEAVREDEPRLSVL
jgi:hypothetical protein